MKFCSDCGNSVTYRIPPDDNRKRFVCDQCGTIHYQNPKVITGCLPVFEDKVLLCKRAIEPRKDLWTLPAGFMENDETSEQGAIREAWEEARTELEIQHLYIFFDLPHISQIYLFYYSKLKTLNFGPGPESLEVKLFSEQEIPWEQIAFKAVKQTLSHYFEDRKDGTLPFRQLAIHPEPNWPLP